MPVAKCHVVRLNVKSSAMPLVTMVPEGVCPQDQLKPQIERLYLISIIHSDIQKSVKSRWMEGQMSATGKVKRQSVRKYNCFKVKSLGLMKEKDLYCHLYFVLPSGSYVSGM